MRRVYQRDLQHRPADQTAEETGTSSMFFVSPGRQHYHRSAAKAWAHILLSGGTPVLITGYNIATVSGPANGMINIAFTTPMASQFYAAEVIAMQTSGGNNAVAYMGSSSTSGNLVVYLKAPATGSLTSLWTGVMV